MSKVREKNGRYAEHGKCMCCSKPLTDEFFGIGFGRKLKNIEKLKEIFFNIEIEPDGFFKGCEDCGNTMHDAYCYILNNPNEDVFYFPNENDFFVWFIETLVLNGYDISPYLFGKKVTLAEKISLVHEIKTETFFAVKAKNGKLYY